MNRCKFLFRRSAHCCRVFALKLVGFRFLALLFCLASCSSVRKNEPIYQANSVAGVKTEQLTRLKLESGGRQRSVLVWLPRDHVFDASYALLFILHGGGGSAEQMVKTAAMNKHGNDFRFVFVYPQGIDDRWADGRGTTEPEKAGVDDVTFFKEMIDTFVASGAVNPAKVYSTGISNGGFMSFRLACELSEKIRGVAPVATAFQARLDESCQSTSSIGTGSVESKDAVSLPVDRTRLETSQGEGCTSGKKFRFVNVRGGGHTWPGGGYQPAVVLGATSQELDASKSILEYFSE